MVARDTTRGTLGSGLSFALINNTDYDTDDLRRFCISGLRALVRQSKQNVPKTIVFVAAPQRSRGCAKVGTGGKTGRDVVIALAPPNRFSLRRLARLFQHEVTHTQGYEHKDMPNDVLWSLGPVPEWAEGAVIRYHGRAPNQIP